MSGRRTSGSASPRDATMSPVSADSGMACTSTKPRCAASAVNSAWIASKRARSQLTRSILFTASTSARNAGPAREERVAPRLRLQAVHGVHQQDGDIRGAGGSDHVARVLLVARRIADDELARGRGEVAVRDVDRDALLALGQQAVGDQREVDRHLAGAARSGFERGHLVGQQALAVPEQAADQRALAVVDAAGGGEAQRRGVAEAESRGIRSIPAACAIPSRRRWPGRPGAWRRAR